MITHFALASLWRIRRAQCLPPSSSRSALFPFTTLNGSLSKKQTIANGLKIYELIFPFATVYETVCGQIFYA
jgi:hypothetical protein